jgi:glycosyltransferase involved in cell wall biosynthesis
VLPWLEIGGMERFAILLAEKLQQRGWRATIYCTQRGGPFVALAQEKAIPVVTTPFRSKWDNLYPADLIAVMKRDRVTLVHSQNGNWLAASIAGQLLRVPVVHTEHGLEGAREPWKLVVQKRIARRLTDCTIAVSQSLQEQLSAQLQVRSTDIHVVRNGIDVDAFRRDAVVRQTVRKELGVENDTVLVGAVARLHPLKGIDVLAEAASLLAPTLKLAIAVVGDGQDRQAIEHQLARSAVRFDLLGMRSDVARLLHAFDLLVMPSRSEALPLALLEAMACELPVIVTDVGEMPAIVGNEAGAIVPPENARRLANAIETLAASTATRQTMGARAAKIVRDRFSLEAMVDQYVEVYERLLVLAA